MNSAFLFGTVGSPISTPKKPGGTVGGIARTRELGLGALELAWVQAVRVTLASCEAIRQMGLQHGIALSVHAPYYINLNAHAEEWPKSRKRLMDAAKYGYLAGATDIVFHPGSYFGLPPEEALRVALPRLRECAAELREAGNPVRLRPETMGKSAMLGSVEDVLAMAEAVGGVLPCMDFAHLHARTGVGAANSYAEWVEILSKMEAALGRASLQNLHIHLSGINYGPKGERNHLPFAKADLKFRELLRALADRECAGRILCESPILEEDALLLQRAWKRIAKKKAASPKRP